jgi:amino acid adenylation domain-containing protein
MAGHYQALLAAAVDDPDTPADALPMLSPAERSELVRRGRRVATYPAERDLAGLFEDAVAAAPDRPAVTWLRDTTTGPEVAVLSYAELDARANRVAHALRRRGVGAEELVGMLLPRGPELVVAQLGALKAGAAYLPLDRSFPADRLATMLGAAGAKLVIADRATAQAGGLGLPDRPDANQATVLTSVEELAGEVPADAAAGPPERAVSSRQLACVMFTSGSTGRPKGVMAEHRGIVQLVWNAGIADFDRGRRVGHAANPAFDATLFEVWGALLHGGTVCVVGAGELLSPWELPVALRRLRVEVLFLTTSLFNEVVSARPDDLCHLEQVLFGGEAADPAVVRALLSHIHRDGYGLCIANVYGPTEATSLATAHPVTEVPESAGRVPIGHPIANTSCYVLDGHLEPVPVGVVGDLYLAGPGLARGYLGDPASTAGSYPPDPLAADGGRMYRTGDRARWLPEGGLEFVGRADEQIKIRGFRVEPGEIRALLLGEPGVAACAVRLWREDEIGRQALVAYAVPDRPGCLDPEAIRTAVARQLPRYMVPTDVIIQDALPLNSHGKVDHASLEPPARRGRREPRSGTTPHERLLCQLWAELLGVEDVDPDDDFYALGGHSLLAVRISARLRHEHGIALRVSQILDAPSIRELARLVPGSTSGG